MNVYTFGIKNRKEQNKFLLLGVKNNEDAGSMCYDRVISYYPFTGFPELLRFEEKDIQKLSIKGVTRLPYVELTDHTGYDLLKTVHNVLINGELIKEDSYTQYLASPKFNFEYAPKPKDPKSLLEVK